MLTPLRIPRFIFLLIDGFKMKKMKFFKICSAVAISLLFRDFTNADEKWSAYLDGNEIQDITINADYIWCATERGGIVKWNRHNGTYKQYTTLEGIITDNVHAVAVDNDGVLWLGTEHGVQSFDGIEWKIYDTEDGLADKNVQGIFVDSNNMKWFWYGSGFSYATKGITRFDDYNWITFMGQDDSSMVSEYVYDVVEDHNGIMWFGTRYGVSSYDGKIWKTYSDEFEDIHYKVRTITIDADGVMWFGGEYGVARYDGESWESYNIREELGYTDTFYDGYNKVYSIAVGENGKIWFATGHELVLFDGETWTTCSKEFNTYIYTTRIIIDSNNVLWCATSHGLLCFNMNTWETLTTAPWCGPWGVSALATDQDGILWIGTQYELSIFDGLTWNKFTFTDILKDDRFSAIAVDEDNVKWIGSVGEEPIGNGISTTMGKVTRFDGESWETFVLGNDENSWGVNSIAVDKENVKWFATNDGAKSFDGTTWTTYTSENSGLPSSLGYSNTLVKEVAVDHDNVKWFCTHGNSPTRYDGSQWETLPTKWNDLSLPRYSHEIVVDKNNIKWFGGKGLFRYDGETWTKYVQNEEQINDNPYKIYVSDLLIIGINVIEIDNDNVLWIGTDNGVSCFDGKICQSYTFDDGLSDNNCIRSMAVKSDNIKWFGTRTGLYKYEVSQVTIESVQKFPQEMYVPSNYPNPFNASTTISFALPATGFTQLVIYNITGQKLRELLSETMTAGFHNVIWDGRDDGGNILSSGIYLSRLSNGKLVTHSRMLLMK